MPFLKSTWILFFVLQNVCGIAQDSIAVVDNISEKEDIKFQNHFFDAIRLKAINQHEKALENLVVCNEIKPNNAAVLFEFSKNYFLLNNSLDALNYCSKALLLKPKNRWLLEHKIKILEKDRNFSEAITTQQELIRTYPKQEENLVRLYLLNNEVEKAKDVIEKIAKKGILSSKLKNLQKKISDNNQIIENKKTVPNSNIKKFIETRDYAALQNILENAKEDKDAETLLKYSEIGLSYFPAQAFVYLMNAVALNKQKKYKNALEKLKTGIDFVIDDKNLTSDFYEQMILSYQGLGDFKNSKTYREKRDKLVKE